MKKKGEFNKKYGHIAYLLFVPIDIPMLKAMMHFWDLSYHCFMFNEIDMVLMIEEYTKLLGMEVVPRDKVYYYELKKSPKRRLSTHGSAYQQVREAYEARQ